MVNYTNDYPTVFVHGLCGWGSNDLIYKVMPYWGFLKSKDLMKHLKGLDYEVYSPSLGPFASAWDRSCELWAQLFGGTVDYGKVHSEKYGHPRYGRTYKKGLIPDWGKEGAHKKINIIGHSFGGPTVKQFAALIAVGSKEEVEGTPAEELSPLFLQDKPQKLHTVTTLSGVNNGTTFASLCGQKGMTVITYGVLMLNTILSETPAMKVYDFHTDIWGIMKEPITIVTNQLCKPLAKIEGIKRYNANQEDSIAHEMQVELVQDVINPKQPVYDKTYYFARRANMSHEIVGGKYWPDLPMNPICKFAGRFCGTWNSKKLRKNYGVDKSWMPNDGFVNVIGQSAPLNQPSKEWTATEAVVPGIWYNMPVEYKDHMSWIGTGERKGTFFKYYEDMLNLFRELPNA